MRLLLAALVTSTATVLASGLCVVQRCAAQVQVASSDKPLYQNGEYRFSVRVPPNLTYDRTAPPNPDHGFSIALPHEEKLWVDASLTEDASVAREVRRVQAGCRLEQKKPTVIDGRKAIALQVSCPATAYDTAYEERVLLAERALPHRSPILYQVGLRTDKGRNSAAATKLFEQLIAGFHFDAAR